MLLIKRKSNVTLVVYLAVHILAATLVFGCENRKSFYDNNRNDINLVPIQMENPEDPIADDIDAVNEDVVVIDLDKPTKARKARVGETPPPPTNPVQTTDPEPVIASPNELDPVLPPPPVVTKPTTPVKPSAPKPTAPSTSGITEASKFIKTAFWVVQNEARKIGTPCNFYLSRVLELAGYSDKSFLANDFDVYARNHFSSYKTEVFSSANMNSERLRLKQHIWSYPARTPFIFQWERAKPEPGHVAIVERIGDQLVVYQASLNNHIARREQTTIDRLMSRTRKARMTVYSEFLPR